MRYSVDDVISGVVDQISTDLTSQLKLTDPNISGVWFQSGHPREIIATIAEMSNATSTKYQRYPLVALFHDFKETYGKEPGIDFSVDLHMIVAVRTDPNYKAKKRIEKSFTPILYPIYTALLDGIFDTGAIMAKSAELIQHVKIDRLYWGNKGLEDMGDNTKNIFNDWIDAIELKFNNLQFYTKPNC